MKAKTRKSRVTLRFFWVNYANVKAIFLSVSTAHYYRQALIIGFYISFTVFK